MTTMKKIVFLFMFLLVLVTKVDAQCYAINKVMYDPHQYIHKPGDPYSPTASGICSFLIPGLGQMISGETVRGLYFLGGYIGCLTISFTGGLLMLESVLEGMEGYDSQKTIDLGIILFYCGMAGMATVNILSIIDAIKVAKVNNMFFQDHRGSMYSLELKPYIEPISINNRLTVPVGLSLSVSF